VPNGVARRDGQTEGQTGPDGVTDGWPDGVARRGGQTGCPTGGQTGWPDGVPNGAGRGARWVARRGGRMGCPTGPDGCHVIGHVIFECHVTRLGWQGVILLPTLVSQR
jgi:hypothetical protein